MNLDRIIHRLPTWALVAVMAACVAVPVVIFALVALGVLVPRGGVGGAIAGGLGALLLGALLRRTR